MPFSFSPATESYENKILTDRTLTIFPFSDESIKINKDDDLLSTLEVDSSYAEILVRDSLYSYLCHKSRSSITNVQLNNNVLATNLCKEILDNSKFHTLTKGVSTDDEFTFQLPQKEYLKTLGVDPDLILIINNVEIANNIQWYFNEGHTGSSTITSSTQYLEAKVDF